LLTLLVPPASSAGDLDSGDVLAFFDEAAAAGTLIGNGPGSSAAKRQNALRNMIESMGSLFDAGFDEEACEQLTDAYHRTDGGFPPGDSVAGEAALGLADLLLSLRLEEGCGITVVEPNAGGTFTGPGGTKVVILPDSVPYEAFISIAPARSNMVTANNGALPLHAAVELVFEPTQFNASVAPPTAPLELTTPAPNGMAPGAQFIVGHQVLADFVEDEVAELREQFVAVAMGHAQDGELVSTQGVFPGVLGGGVFAFLDGSGSGFVTGTVSRQICILFICIDIPESGVTVSNSTNTLVSVTNFFGRFSLFINGGPFTVTAFNPFRGSSGAASGNITVDGSTVTADITTTPLVAPAITRDGIRNSGFERCDLTSWGLAGAVDAVQQLGPTSSNVTITPTEGNCMADISTGAGSVGGVGSSLNQRFTVPAGVRTLRLDFNFVSEEFPEFVGTMFDDSFRARISTPDGSSTFAQTRVNDSGGFTLIGDCFFPGGDSTCGQTGWRQGSVDLSAYAGTNTPITVELLFSAVDSGDNIYDTHVLVDNIRFSTLWIDAKILVGPTVAAGATANRVQTELLAANEILSQAGMNVRLRGVQTVNTTDALVDTDITWVTGANCADGRVNGRLTAEETAVLGLARSAVNTDLNVYYVRSGTGLAGVGGFALGPDDFCVDVNILNNSGTFQMDIGGGGNVLAHEIGHIVIAPNSAGNVLEHSAPAGNFLSTTPALGIVNRQQSGNINRAGAPLLRP
jgi:hypothetical protein